MNLQNYYDTVIRLSHGIVVTFDLEGGIIHGNSQLERLTGHSMKELAGKDWFETFFPERRRFKARSDVKKACRRQGISAMSGAIDTKDGDRVYIDWHIKPLADSSGEIISILCVGQDVTGHVQREKGLLRERSTLLERNKELSCLYHISLQMAETEPELDVILRRIVNLLPYGFQHPPKTHVSLTIDDTVVESAAYQKTEDTLSEDIIVNKEKRGVLAVSFEDGHSSRERSSEFIEDETDLLATTAQLISMIVLKREARKARLRLEQLLRQADRLAKIGQFSAGLAHEINEPLANILGFAQLALQSSELPEQVRQDLEKIVDSSLHAREIIRKVMFFSRQMPASQLPTDINETIREALQITEGGARRSGVEIVCNFDESLPLLTADPQHLKQVVVNLVANAVQAMTGGGTLTVTTINHQGDSYIVVQDTGPGIPEDNLKQIFNPFFTTKDVDKGTGLGLSVVHGIVKAHGGFIQVESQPGQGTRFEVGFPGSKNKEQASHV